MFNEEAYTKVSAQPVKQSFNLPKITEIQENVPLAPLTTLKIGGPARYFARAETEADALAAIEFSETNGIDLFVLGGGSNVLIADNGFSGLVVHVAIAGINVDIDTSATDATITAGAGEEWDKLVALAVENDLAGFECLSGIPGFVGGTPVQNVGAYGQEVSGTIISVRCFDRDEKSIVDLPKAECGFSYRTSIFNSTYRGRYIVLSVTYRLRRNGQPHVKYKDLEDLFADRTPTLPEVRDSVLKIRRAKSMVIDASDPNNRSAGSFFKNPVVDASLLASIQREYSGERVPHFPAGGRDVKIPAAWLIEHVGFVKGFRLGKAGISSNHSLALINLGGATAAEIIELKNLIQSRVEIVFDIRLETEPVFVGF
ncbi:MAG: UDP-N-acetylmuramate dehydrogenase [Pyrinomonadaceae bacterium]